MDKQLTVRLQETSVQHHHCVTVRSKNTAGQWDQRDLSNLGEACGRLALPWNWMSLGEWWTIKGRGQTKRDILICLLIGCMTEKAMATHSSTLACKIPWMEEPGRLRSMGSWRVKHDWATSLSLFTFLNWRRKWQPTPVFFPGESQGWGSLVAAIYGVTQSQTWLKWHSSSSSTQNTYL